LSVVVVLMIVIGGFGALLWANSSTSAPAFPVVPTEARPTEDSNVWQEVLRAGFGSGGTPLPTIAVPQQPYAPPTLDVADAPTPTPVQASELGSSAEGPVAVAVTPTLPPLTVTSEVEVIPVTAQAATPLPIEQWKPPALLPPLNRDPFGRDHYWFLRPVDSNANNAGRYYYSFGSDGPAKDNPLIVHLGSTCQSISQAVRGGRLVVWASGGLHHQIAREFTCLWQCGGDQYDFGYEGQKLWTCALTCRQR
jgi:hypothetical protein